MGKSYEALKGKLAAYKAWLAVKLGNARVAELEAKQANYDDLLTLSDQLLGVAAKQQEGMVKAFGLLQEQASRTERNSAVTIAALLTVNGGEVSVTADTIKAVDKSDINIDYLRDSDGTVTLKLLSPEEAAASESEGYEDDDTDVNDDEHCDGGCECGQKPESPAQAA